jgi:hypothetical protein
MEEEKQVFAKHTSRKKKKKKKKDGKETNQSKSQITD